MKDSYGEYSDEELIVLLRDGENDITDYIMEKYKGMVKTKAKSMYLLGGDSNDLIQEGMIGLFKAIRDYDSGRDASFSTFADLCVSRQMYTAVQASSRKKHMPLGVVMDERIATGIEYSRFFAAFSRYLKNPESLETRLDGREEKPLLAARA